LLAENIATGPIRYARLDFVSETTQLKYRTDHFAIQAHFAQASFTVSDGDQFGLALFEGPSQPAQQCCTDSSTRLAPEGRRRSSFCHGLVDRGQSWILMSCHWVSLNS
jgi:hypothetical protein